MEDGQTFESYGIEEGETIGLTRPDYAERDEVFHIYVQLTEEEVFRVRIKASDTVGSLKTRLWNGGLTTSGENTKQHAENLSVIDEFRGTWIDQQHLVFYQQRLEDDRNSFYYKVQENAVMRFPCKMDKVYPISIKPVFWDHDEYGGKILIRNEVTGSETIGNLKARLWDGGLIPRSKRVHRQLRS